MKPKLEVSVSEMMQLRNDGYSNADIARILDISLPTVYKYIGKQGCHIPSATASFITKPTTNVPDDTTTQQEVMVISRVVAIDGYLFELSSDGIADSSNSTSQNDLYGRRAFSEFGKKTHGCTYRAELRVLVSI